MSILNEVTETIQLNHKELLSMTKEYMFAYMQSLLLDLYGLKRRKDLRKKFTEYCEAIKLENLYLAMIADNIDFIDQEKAEVFIEKLNTLNEETFFYYEFTLNEFEESIYQEDGKQVVKPNKNFKTITEDVELYLEALNIFALPQGVEIKQDSKKINKILNKSIKK